MLGVVYVGTPALKSDLMAEKGLERPPEVEIGAGWYVQGSEDMANAIIAVRPGARQGARDPRVDRIKKAQGRIAAYNDGKATERVWQEMQKLLAN